MVNQFTTNEPRVYIGEISIFSINGFGKTRQPHAKEWNWMPIHTPKTKINSKRSEIWIYDLKPQNS